MKVIFVERSPQTTFSKFTIDPLRGEVRIKLCPAHVIDKDVIVENILQHINMYDNTRTSRYELRMKNGIIKVNSRGD